jgi:hypothetical protein
MAETATKTQTKDNPMQEIRIEKIKKEKTCT